ncbi:terminase small subunit [Pseudomonas tussilaginis]|jgi:phage terminase small subunit|uniref:terminase small subunit n=1 Tax=Pseudomonas putida TaxID=303 RepID=UPI000F90AF32|nr:terminase small subunit [Pseudomonas putida]MDD1976939.1 terminase small subunit [Pseudomonas putida]
MALTPKKRAFVDALRGGASNKDAAIAAGYAASSASQAGSRLAKDPLVLAELAALGFNKNVKASKAPAKPIEPAHETLSEDREPSFDLSKALTFSDPKAFLLATMNDFEAEPKLRVDAAKALMPFIHPRKGEGGKKDEKEQAAQRAASRFGASAAPPLRSVK